MESSALGTAFETGSGAGSNLTDGMTDSCGTVGCGTTVTPECGKISYCSKSGVLTGLALAWFTAFAEVAALVQLAPLMLRSRTEYGIAFVH